jgi:hypothetical protein
MDEQGKIKGINDFRQYAWDYFHYHASQRLTTFNFYIIICTLGATGYVAAIKEERTEPFGIFMGLLLIVLSFIFWKLDLRNKQLIENAEDALKHLESETVLQETPESPHVLKIFTYEEAQTNRAKKKPKSFRLWKPHYSYSNCFNVIFFVFGALGLLAALYAAIAL